MYIFVIIFAGCGSLPVTGTTGIITYFLGGWCKIMEDISQVCFYQEPFALAGIVSQCNRSYVIGELSG